MNWQMIGISRLRIRSAMKTKPFSRMARHAEALALVIVGDLARHFLDALDLLRSNHWGALPDPARWSQSSSHDFTHS